MKRRTSMPSNGSSNDPSSTLVNSEATAPKKGKSRSTRATRKPAGSTSARSGAPRSSEPSEILFTVEADPSKTPQPPYIWIDHPQQGERLLGPVYVVRLGVGGAEQVEICVDGGVWQPCRLTSGYWWFDWSKIRPGRHTLTARMQTTDGRWFRTP